MRKIIYIILFLFPLITNAQSADAKYLAGAVPEIDGKVVFETTISTTREKHDIFMSLSKWFKERKDSKKTLVVNSDSENFIIGSRNSEYLIFEKRKWSTDQSRINYNISATVLDNNCKIVIEGINYIYDEERGGINYKAEEWITDKYGLNKKKTSLAKMSGKFRVKTIDLVDSIFDEIKSILE